MNSRRIISCSTLVVFVLLLAACASNKVDWNTRVGKYTYDQAVADYGPPDKMAMLSDNSKVAEWYTGYSRGMSVGVGTGVGPFGMGVGVPVGGNKVRSMRLIFAPDDVLKSWSK